MSLDPRSFLSRVLAVFFLLLSMWAVWSISFAPLLANAVSQSQEIDALTQKRDRLFVLAAMPIPEFTGRNGKTQSVINAPSEAAAQVALQRLVRASALANRVEVRSVSAQAGKEGNQTIAILVVAEASTTALMRFLYRIEKTDHQMWSRDMRIRVRSQGREVETSPSLDVNIIVEAVWGNYDDGGLE